MPRARIFCVSPRSRLGDQDGQGPSPAEAKHRMELPLIRNAPDQLRDRADLLQREA